MPYFNKTHINNLYNHTYNKEDLRKLKKNYTKNINTYKHINNDEFIKICRLKFFTYDILKELSDNFKLPVLIKKYFTEPKSLLNPTIINNKLQIYNEKDEIIKINYKNYNEKIHTIFNDSIKMTSLYLNNEFFKKSFKINRFISRKETITCLHNELHSTLNIQVKGTKEWILINPVYYDFLIPSYFKDHFGKVCFSQTINNNNFNNLSIKCPHIKVNVEKGDILYVPSWWWHQVCSLTNSESYSIRTIYKNPYHPIYNNNKLFCNLVYYIPKQLLKILKGSDDNSETTMNSGSKKYFLEQSYFKDIIKLNDN